jgi:hypothetical protein
MGPDSIHFETIKLIRQITSDGKLEVEEVWDLADHLNNNRLARKRWPGTHLWPIIEQVFEDNVVTSEEMRMLGVEISKIEDICSELTHRTNNDRPEFDLSQIRVSPLEAPVVGKTIYSTPRGESQKLYACDLSKHSCTCEDWRDVHEVIPDLGIGRLCKHLVDAFREVHEDTKVNTEDWPDPIANVIFMLHRFKLPAEPLTSWEFLEWAKHDAFVAYGSSDWTTVFANKGESRYERFGYNVAEARWSYGAQPPGADILAGYFEHVFNPYQPSDELPSKVARGAR